MSNGLETLKSKGVYALHPDLLLTPDGALNDVVMVIDGGKITAIKPVAGDNSSLDDGIEIIRLKDQAIIPGIIDTHHHVAEPFAKAITCGEPAQMWKRIWLPLEEAATPESTYISAKWTFIEAIRGGFTTIVDHGIRESENTEAVLRAAEEIGLRLVSSTGVYDLSDFETDATKPKAMSTIDDAVQVAEDHIVKVSKRWNITPSIACGTVQSNSGDMIKFLAEYCEQHNIIFQIHANEHTEEIHRCIERYGKRPIEYLHALGALRPTTLIAHATLVTSKEIKLLCDTGTAVSYNPVASQWKGNGVAPAIEYARQGVRFGLGTDATRNDAFRLLDAAESCQRIAYGLPNDDFSCGAGWLWVDAATRAGAEVIGLGTITGRLEPGYEADFLVLDMATPEVLPSWDFTWELVRYYDRANIKATFVAGEPLVVDGKPTGLDIEDFIQKNLPIGVKSIQDADIIRLHGPSVRYRPEINFWQ